MKIATLMIGVVLLTSSLSFGMDNNITTLYIGTPLSSLSTEDLVKCNVGFFKQHKKLRPGKYGKCLVGADLSNANFKRADLTGADLTNANLSGSSFNFSTLQDTILTNTNLTSTNLLMTDPNYTIEELKKRGAVWDEDNPPSLIKLHSGRIIHGDAEIPISR